MVVAVVVPAPLCVLHLLPFCCVCVDGGVVVIVVGVVVVVVVVVIGGGGGGVGGGVGVGIDSVVFFAAGNMFGANLSCPACSSVIHFGDGLLPQLSSSSFFIMLSSL